MPSLSIVMPVFNAQRYLSAAVASMSAQTWTDWEMVCIDDGSTDESGRLLAQFAQHDQRIRVLRQSNQGIVGALNSGLAEARGQLIARMDADDIAMPDRLALQVAYLQAHPDCVACGGAILKIDADSDPLGVDRLPEDHAAIEASLLRRRTGMYHPTVLFRAQAVRAIGGYRPEHQHVEDHDLWLRLASSGRLANLADIVLCYRLHAESICWQRASTQRQRMNTVLEEAYAARGMELPAELRASQSQHRSAGGPGKWARMAAKGYAPRTALKHLGKLWREPASLPYRLRMTSETVLRIAASLPALPRHRLPQVPRLGA